MKTVLCWLALCLVTVVVGKGAPAPTPRKPGPILAKQLQGTWSLVWSGGNGRCHMAADGGWTCEWCGDTWVGTWRWEKETLYVMEHCSRPDEPPGEALNWSAPMKRDGKVLSGGKDPTVELRKEK